MNRLMLLAGKTDRTGWKTLDNNPCVNPTFLASIPPLPATVLGEKWDEVEWVHGVGTLFPWEAEEVLTQIRACLSDDGVLVLEQPNAEEVAKAILMREEYVWWMFGDPSHRDPGMMNRWCYTPNSLAALLSKVGYSRIEVMPARYHGAIRRDFRIEARI